MTPAGVKPGKAARFAVIDSTDRRRSMTWTVITAKRTLDVYIMARCMGHLWKMSLHKTGDWHSGFTEAGAQHFIPDAKTRHFDHWSAPETFAPGFHRSVQIVVPDSELRSWPSDTTEAKPEKVLAIPAPGAGNVTLIEVIFAPIGDREPIELELDAAFHFATLERADKSTVFVVAFRRGWVAADRLWLERWRQQALASVPAEWWRSVSAPRCCALGTQDDGTRYVIDLAADRPAGH